MDDAGCIGEDDELQHIVANDGEREDTEIDFIQQVDTDRQALNPDHDKHLHIPVVSENQIEIKSKHQENIQNEIFAKQDQKPEEPKSPLEPR